MTDPTEPTDSDEIDAPLTPAQDAAVRRALADAGGPEPLPEEIADRLDAVITGLAAGRRPLPEISHPEDHRVLPLDPAARRRRMRARFMLVAAAAVVVGAVGIGVVNDGATDDLSAADQMAEGDPARSDAGGAIEDGAIEDGSASGDDGKAFDEDSAEQPPAAAPDLVVEPQRIVVDQPLREVRATNLREDLVALQHSTLPNPATDDYSGATLTAPASFVCEPADFGRGYLVGIEYDGKPAIAAFREPVGQTQAAEVLACGTGDVLHSTTLPTTH